jgi:uncharacterized LabA/DUF88 family protein
MAKQKRVVLAVDAANLTIAANEAGARIHHEAALAYAGRNGPVVRAGFYAPRGNGAEKERQQLIALKQAGFDRMVVRSVRQRPDGTNKSDIDVVIAMDVWGAAVRDEVDVVVLCSGDSDFVPLVEWLVERGIEVHVIGPDRGTAWELAVTATRFLYASQVEGLVQGGTVGPTGVLREDRPQPGVGPTGVLREDRPQPGVGPTGAPREDRPEREGVPALQKPS